MPDELVHLSNGVSMPAVQLGTFRARGEPVREAVTAAIRLGYRAVDTAAVYRNHVDIAAALASVLPEMKLTRENIFLTSKLAPRDQGTEGCRTGVETALRELGTDYLDLFLIHWPGVQKLAVDDPANRELRAESWAVMEEYYRRGVLKAIGVSNYTIEHLTQILNTCSVKPHVNQVEVHPHYPQTELIQFCRENNIHVQAYSSLGQAGQLSPLFQSEDIQEISQHTSKSIAQVLLKWGLQHGLSVLPKSTNPAHIAENFSLDFTLSTADMATLDSLHLKHSQKYAWDPATVS